MIIKSGTFKMADKYVPSSKVDDPNLSNSSAQLEINWQK